MEIKESLGTIASLFGSFSFANPQELWNNIIDSNIDASKYLSFFIDYNYDYNEDSPGSISLYGIREETEEEMAKRLEHERYMRAKQRIQAKALKEKKQAEELALYEKLKKKYDK